MGKTEQTQELESAALQALERANRDDRARWSDDALAKRLRAKRLGLDVGEEYDPRRSIIDTLREINWLMISPWATVNHPFVEVRPQAPTIRREMGSHVLDLFSDLTKERAQPIGGPMVRTVVLDDLDYERSASMGRSEQMLNEVRWFVDGQLAIAWNVVMHRRAIEVWDVELPQSASTALFNAHRALKQCVRVHSSIPEDALAFHVAADVYDEITRRGAVTLASKLKHSHPVTVWGNVPVSPNDDALAKLAALSAVHRFRASL